MSTLPLPETGLFCWVELHTLDPGAARVLRHAAYTVFQQGEVPVGGLVPQQITGAPSVWASYFAVTDAGATFATAAKLGATVLMPLTDLPGVGRFGWLQDPQGAVFGVIKNATPEEFRSAAAAR